MTAQEAITLGIAATGAVTGVASLVIMWLQARFALVIERAELRYEPEAVQQLRARPPEQLGNSFFEFELELGLHNRLGGKGSIEKPRLEVRLPSGTVYVAHPKTESLQSRPDERRGNVTHHWVERSGTSYYFEGHQRRDDALQYTFDFTDGQPLHELLDQFDSLAFRILYRDNRGREQTTEITDLVPVEQII